MTRGPVHLLERILKLVVSVVYSGILACYRAAYRLARGAPRERRLIVLTYHGIGERDVPRFEKQMRVLKDRVLPMFADASAKTNGRQGVAVTFDDGFQSTVRYALPVLDKYQVPATMFVPTGFLGEAPGWIHDAARTGDAVVSAQMLRRLDQGRVRIGSHSVTHPRLAVLEPRLLRTELVDSKGTLEMITGQRVRMLALPYGSFNANVIAVAGQVGYERVFTNVPVGRRARGSVLLEGRINASPRDWPMEFRLKIHGAYAWLVVAIRVKRAVVGLFGKVGAP
jgi:peptidoglycan/xylan/chitin deacetylase (PgdA/CDA1 family)